ncbi:hypothetical protein CRI94_13765 [Longibacter salinarum]|uniref:Uncharacterized protein n=1 Tax=Longibacter salinarum TaxID=1850348 RepID=A0A2A8CVF2_9BACT|nr:hypothetical protein CRI94_13765 [Longibacter salinarum]
MLVSNGASVHVHDRDAGPEARAASGEGVPGTSVATAVAFAPVSVEINGKGRAVFPYSDATNNFGTECR